MATTKRVMASECYCISCQRDHLSSEFYKSNNPFHPNGFVPYCKSATKDIMNYYLKKTQNLEATLWLTCSVIGIPFIKRAYEMVEADIKDKSKKKDYNYIGMYIAKLPMIDVTIGEKKYKDFSDTDVGYGEVNSLRKAEEALKSDYEKFELEWGEQSVEDYTFLENLYNKYTEDLELDSQQEDLYRDLCLARLRKRKLESGINEEIDEQALSKVQSQIFNIMNKLKIDDFEKTKKSPIDQLIFERIKMIEETMPCEDPDLNKYKDSSGIGKYLKDLVFRPMLNTLVGARDFNVKDVKDYTISDDL